MRAGSFNGLHSEAMSPVSIDAWRGRAAQPPPGQGIAFAELRAGEKFYI
jgi:hypothetical protein